MEKSVVHFFYKTKGDPGSIPLIFIHGFLGSHRDWDKITDKISSYYHCISIDLPGHGQTRLTGDESHYSFESVAGGLVEWMETLNIKQSHLAGYSMGGRLALYLALQYPQRWKKIIIESASPGIKSESDRRQRNENDAALAKQLENTDLKIFLQNWYNQDLFKSMATNINVKALINSRLNNNAAELAGCLRNLGPGRQPSLWHDLAKLDRPVLLLAGEFDKKYRTIMKKMQADCPAAELKIADGVGHNIHLENSGLYIDLILDFLNNQEE